MQYITNNINLLFVVAVVGFSVLSWVVRKLKEQAMLRQQQQLRERMRLEALRTGRSPAEPQPQAAPQPSPEQRLAELAARRAELVRQSRPPVQTRANAPRPPQTTQRQAPAGAAPSATRSPVLRAPPQRTPQPVQRQAPQPVQRPVARPARPIQPASPAQRRQEMLEARRRALESRARPQPPQAPPPPPTRGPGSIADAKVKAIADIDPFAAGTAKLKISRARLREAIVLREILDAPIALRRENEL